MHPERYLDRIEDVMEELMRFVVGKGVGLPVDRVFGFEREEVVAAYECLKGGWHVGKVCIGFVKG